MNNKQDFDNSIYSYKQQLMNFYTKNNLKQTTSVNNDDQTPPVEQPKINSSPSDNSDNTLSPDAQFELYKKEHSALGKLVIKAYTARRAFPVEGSIVEVAKVFPTGKYIISRTTTNESGMTDTLLLPTARKPMSLEPGEPKPYATYTVTVYDPRFVPTRISNVPVFDDITSVQTVDLIPPAANSTGKEIIEYTAYEPNL
ncbi:MAG: hypothetical protein RR048_06490 [Oscillospiraceae bacterium]